MMHNWKDGQSHIHGQYAHVVLTVIQFMKCVALFVAPATVAMFVSDESQYDQWRYVFWLHGIFLIIANFMFFPIATDKPASFTTITRASKNDEAAHKLRDGNPEDVELNDAAA
ncbi:hypothetical protein Y032_0004g1841 [Ancylostoma ceylanicum]|uniref:Major facilitator superfamily (MFS) profile domain-containing protein n=2 Tax=Ancylostoma ceylanicum TaxID=53326 RepID=A0A016VU95_9BILA|nr:hypothetical protein Y032_0004g1841 [Ancylostoma ceylanicum]